MTWTATWDHPPRLRHLQPQRTKDRTEYCNDLTKHNSYFILFYNFVTLSLNFIHLVLSITKYKNHVILCTSDTIVTYRFKFLNTTLISTIRDTLNDLLHTASTHTHILSKSTPSNAVYKRFLLHIIISIHTCSLHTLLSHTTLTHIIIHHTCLLHTEINHRTTVSIRTLLNACLVHTLTTITHNTHLRPAIHTTDGPIITQLNPSNRYLASLHPMIIIVIVTRIKRTNNTVFLNYINGFI